MGFNAMGFVDDIINYAIAVIVVGAVLGALGVTIYNAIVTLSQQMTLFGLAGLFATSLVGLLFAIIVFKKVAGMLGLGKGRKY